MTRKMKYSLYKRYYSQFQAHDYDSKTKSIMVDLPDTKRNTMPKEWKKHSIFNAMVTPGGCAVYTWGSGLAMSHRVERWLPPKPLGEVYCIANPTEYMAGRSYSVDVCPGIDRYERLMAAVEELEKIV